MSGWLRVIIPDPRELALSLLPLGVPLLPLPLLEERLRRRWSSSSSSSSELRPEESEVLTNTNVATEDVGESVGSMGVSGGDTDSDPDTVGVVDLSASFSATCLRKSEWELTLWNRFGGVPSPFMTCFAWLFSPCILPDLSFEDLWEETNCGRDTCTSDDTTVALVGNGADEPNLRWTLGEWGGESESILVLLFCGAVGNLAPLRRIKIHMGALATTTGTLMTS